MCSVSRRLLGATLFIGIVAWSGLVVAESAVAPQHIDVHIRARQVIEPQTRRIVVAKNTILEIHWHSDESGALHVHGYDIDVRLQANKTVTSRFLAKASGRYPVTSHGFADQTGHAHEHGALLYIEVHPD